MRLWRPHFVTDLGDFGCQAGEGQTTLQLHDAQRTALAHHVGVFSTLSCPRYHVIGNHDVGWLRGGEEDISPADLIGQAHAGEDITKQEFLATTGTPHRYYAFDAEGFHCIVLDGNNAPATNAPQPRSKRGRDGVVGAYWIDATQRKWLADDLANHRRQPKLVFCHEELHHTPLAGSPQGGDRPFPPVGKQGSYIDNGWQVRQLLAADGRVIACFFGHKHRSRWTVYDRTHYLTMAATHWKASFAAVEISDQLTITGFGGQRSYRLPLLIRPS